MSLLGSEVFEVQDFCFGVKGWEADVLWDLGFRAFRLWAWGLGVADFGKCMV